MLSMPRIVRPDLFHFQEQKLVSPLEPALGRPIKPNKELPKSQTDFRAVKRGRLRPNPTRRKPRTWL